MSTFDKFKCRWRRSLDGTVGGIDKTDEYCIGDGEWCKDSDNGRCRLGLLV